MAKRTPPPAGQPIKNMAELFPTFAPKPQMPIACGPDKSMPMSTMRTSLTTKQRYTPQIGLNLGMDRHP